MRPARVEAGGGAETATAEIRWQTDEPATSVVDYRRAGDPTYQRLEDLALVEDHVLVLTDLETATTYELVVTSADRHGNPASTSTTLTTLTAPDVTAPVITSGPMITVTTTTATVQWTTHEQATTIVQYDAVVGDGRLDRQRFSADAIDHSVTLTDLAPNTEHELRVLSADASGNGPTASPVVRFRTAALPNATAPVIVAGPDVAYLSNNLVIVLWSPNPC